MAPPRGVTNSLYQAHGGSAAKGNIFSLQGAESQDTERHVPSCSSGEAGRAVRRRRRSVWERWRLACDLGVKESMVEQDQ